MKGGVRTLEKTVRMIERIHQSFKFILDSSDIVPEVDRSLLRNLL